MKVVYELIDAELDAVCGGIFDFTNLSNNIVAQANTATQVGVAQGGSSVFGAGGAANVAQLLAPVEHQLDRLTYGSPHTPGCSPGCAGTHFNRQFSWTRAPSLRELRKEGLDTVSMRDERTRATRREMLIPQGMARPGPSKAIPLPTAVFSK